MRKMKKEMLWFILLQEMYDRAFVLSGKREPDLTSGFSTYLKYKNITFNALFSFSFGNKMRLNDLYESSGQRLPYRTRICPVNL